MNEFDFKWLIRNDDENQIFLGIKLIYFDDLCYINKFNETNSWNTIILESQPVQNEWKKIYTLNSLNIIWLQ